MPLVAKLSHRWLASHKKERMVAKSNRQSILKIFNPPFSDPGSIPENQLPTKLDLYNQPFIQVNTS